MATILYTVRPGDTLWSIANKYNTTVNAIARYNGIVNTEEIYAGQVLRIETQKKPTPKWYIVQPGDTLFTLANRFNTSVDQIVDANNLDDPDLIYPGQVLLIK